MENQTVYAKLKKGESFMQQIPEEIRTLFNVRVTHTESDSVVVSFRPQSQAYVGFLIEMLKDVRVTETPNGKYVNISTNGSETSLHDTGYSHTTLF